MLHQNKEEDCCLRHWVNLKTLKKIKKMNCPQLSHRKERAHQPLDRLRRRQRLMGPFTISLSKSFTPSIKCSSSHQENPPTSSPWRKCLSSRVYKTTKDKTPWHPQKDQSPPPPPSKKDPRPPPSPIHIPCPTSSVLKPFINHRTLLSLQDDEPFYCLFIFCYPTTHPSITTIISLYLIRRLLEIKWLPYLWRVYRRSPHSSNFYNLIRGRYT